MSKKRINKKLSSIAAVILALAIFLAVSRLTGHNENFTTETTYETQTQSYSLGSETLPGYSGSPYAVIDGNTPEFKNSSSVNKSYERYGELDSLGRCTACEACVGKDLMPSGERGSISAVKPTGWQSAKYDFIDGKNLYNRCHLIAYQLTGENANAQNLITGTRYMNVSGMLPFEDEVADYVKSTGNHVLYRVTPVFRGDELVARGVHMEALSVEDGGEAVKFNVYCYNVQPGVEIDYKTGKSEVSGESSTAETRTAPETKAASDKEDGDADGEYILNVKNKKFHRPSCDSVKKMSEKNKQTFKGKRSELIDKGYSPCGSCKP